MRPPSCELDQTRDCKEHELTAPLVVEVAVATVVVAMARAVTVVDVVVIGVAEIVVDHHGGYSDLLPRELELGGADEAGPNLAPDFFGMMMLRFTMSA